MQSNLKGIIMGSIELNESLINHSRKKFSNQKFKEKLFVKRIKKGLNYGLVASMLVFGVYYSYVGLVQYKAYLNNEQKKVSVYEKKFNEVKYYFEKKRYRKSDRLSKNLQSETENCWFFSPVKDLHEKIKEFDKKFIDPKIEKLNSEGLTEKLNRLSFEICDEIDYQLSELEPEERSLIYFGCSCLGFYILRKIFKRKN